jgi:hypothetical protein
MATPSTASVGHMVSWPLPIAKTKRFINECEAFFAVSLNFDHFEMVDTSYNQTFRFKKTQVGENTKMLISFLAALNTKLAIGDAKPAAVDKEKFFYLDQEQERPKMKIIFEILKSEENVNIGLRIWFFILDQNFASSVGKTVFKILGDNEEEIKNKKIEDIQNKTQRPRKEDNSDIRRIHRNVDKNTFVHDILKNFSYTEDESDFDVNTITENQFLTVKDAPFNPLNFFSPKRSIEKAPIRTCEKQRSIEQYFDDGTVSTETFKGFPIQYSTSEARPQFFTPDYIDRLPIIKVSSSIIKKLGDLTKDFDAIKANIKELGALSLEAKRKNNDAAFKKYGDDILAEQERLKDIETKLKNERSSQISKQVRVGFKGSNFENIQKEAAKNNWTIAMRERNEDDTNETPELQRSNRASPDYHKNKETEVRSKLDVFLENCSNMELMTDPFKQVVEFLKKNAGTIPFFPTNCQNLSPQGNALAYLAYVIDRVYKVNNGVLLVLANLIALLNAATYGYELMFNLLVTSDPETGKSKATNTMIEISVPGTTNSIAHETPKSHATSGDGSDMCYVYHEAPHSFTGVGSDGKKVPEDPTLKTRFTERKLVTSSIDKDPETQQRITTTSIRRMHATCVANSNEKKPTNGSALDSRMVQIYAPQVKTTTTTETVILSADLADRTPLRVVTTQSLRLVHAYTFIWEKLIEAKIFPQINTEIYKVHMRNFIDRLHNKHGIPRPSTRTILMIESGLRSLHMYTSVMSLFGEIGDIYRGDSKDSTSKNSWINTEVLLGLRALGVMKEEIVVYGLTLFEEIFLKRAHVDVCHALSTLILKREVPEEKRNLIFVPEKLMKNDLNGVLSNGLMKSADQLPWKQVSNKGVLSNDYNYLGLFYSGRNENQFAHTLNNFIDNKIGLPNILSVIESLQSEMRTVKIKTLSANDEIVDTKTAMAMPVLIKSETKSGKLAYFLLIDAIIDPKPKNIIEDCLRYAIENRNILEPRVYITGSPFSRVIKNPKTGLNEEVFDPSILKTLTFKKDPTKTQIIDNEFVRNKAEIAFLYGVPKEDILFPSMDLENEAKEDCELANAHALIAHQDYNDIISINYWVENGLIQLPFHLKHRYNIFLGKNVNTIIKIGRATNKKYNGKYQIPVYPDDMVSILEDDKKAKETIKANVDKKDFAEKYDASRLRNTVGDETYYPSYFSIEDGVIDISDADQVVSRPDILNLTASIMESEQLKIDASKGKLEPSVKRKIAYEVAMDWFSKKPRLPDYPITSDNTMKLTDSSALPDARDNDSGDDADDGYSSPLRRAPKIQNKPTYTSFDTDDVDIDEDWV